MTKIKKEHETNLNDPLSCSDFKRLITCVNSVDTPNYYLIMIRCFGSSYITAVAAKTWSSWWGPTSS